MVVKLDLGGALKRVQFHFPKVQIKHDEWVEIDSPRLALLHSKTTRPPQKETASREEKQSTASTGPQKAPKASASDGISRKRPGAKKKTGLQGEKRSNNAKKRKTTEENGSPSNTFQDKSYLHSPKSNTKEIASINKLSTVVSSELESSTLSPPKAVTDESSPEDSQAKKNAEKAKGNSSSWTIPKKKPSTPKTSLLLLSPIPSETASISPEKVVKAKVTALTKENSGERIPRKPIPAAKEERDLSLQDLKGRPQVHDSQFSVHKPSENFKSSVPNRDTRRSADSKYDHSTRPGESYRGRWKSDDGIDHNCRQSVDRHKQQTEDQYQLQRRPTEDGYDQSRRQMPVEGDHRRWNRDGGSDRHRQLAEDEYHCHRRPTEDENDRTRRREDDYDHQRRRRPDGEYETHRWRHTYAEYEPDYNRWRSDVARGSPGKRNRDYNGRDSWHRYNPSDRSPSQRRHLDGNARHGNQPYGSREIFKDRGSRSGNRDETYPDGRIGFYGRDRSNPASPEVVSRSRSYEHGNH